MVKGRPTSGLATRCACNEKKKFPIRSLQEKMEKQSFNTINPDNIAYVSTRMLPSAKNLGGIANFIQGTEAKFSIGKSRQAVKNQVSEMNEIKQKDFKEHLKQHKKKKAILGRRHQPTPSKEPFYTPPKTLTQTTLSDFDISLRKLR